MNAFPDSVTPPPAALPRDTPGERLQNVLAHRGVASRRHAADIIANGSVTVNGKVIFAPGFRVDPTRNDIRVNGERLAKTEERSRTILLHKPAGLICSADSSRGQTVCDLMRPHFRERIVPVGRLDKESEGLLLLSNDGELIHRMTHPRYGHSKTYLVRVAGRMAASKIELLRSRLEIDGYTIRPVKVEVLKEGRDNTHLLAFTLSEGRNRQIRKMCSLAHFVVLNLTRVRIGPLKIGTMRPGEWRELSEAEVRALKRTPSASVIPPPDRGGPTRGGTPPHARRPKPDLRPPGPRKSGPSARCARHP